MPTNKEPKDELKNRPSAIRADIGSDELISKADLLERSRSLINEKIARLKSLLADSVLSGEDILKGMNCRRVKERIQCYEKIETLLQEVIEELFERKEICQDKN